MRRLSLVFIIALFTSAALAQQAGTAGPYKVLKTAKVGGEGGTDYIFADTVGRRLYITRNQAAARPATDTAPAVPAAEGRLTIFDLDTLEPVGAIPGVAGNGATTIVKEKSPTTFEVEQNLQTWPSNGARTVAFDSKTGHLFAMASEVGPPPPPPPAGATPPAGGRGGGRGSAIPGSFTIIMIGK